MKDNEIVKALECCLLDNKQHGERCSECPMYETPLTVCQNLLAYHSLNLTNRQKAEIERLESHNNKLMETVENLIYECDCAKQEIIKDFEERLLAIKIKPEFPWDDFFVTEDMINSVAKDMIKEIEQ